MSCTKMDRPSDIEVLCRLCLVKDQVHIPIFEEQGDIRQIFLKISCCLPVSISREDNLPKKICDNCSNKLDSLYEFWNTSVNAEKTLLSWLGQAGVKYTDNAISAVVQQITKPETEIKIEDETFEDGEVEPIEINDKDDEAEEIDDGEMEDFDDGEVEDIEDDEPPPPKRARRSAALKAQETLANISDDDEDEEFDTAELVTEVKEESDESEGEVKDPSILNAVPGTSANDQPGPSGLGKNGPDAPLMPISIKQNEFQIVMEEHTDIKEEPLDIKEADLKDILNECEGDEMSQPQLETARHKHKCSLCYKSFKLAQSLNQHFEIDHSNYNSQIECKICCKSFKNKRCLKSHVKSLHSGIVKLFKCDFCNKTFKYKYSLNCHVKRVHLEPDELFNCNFCVKSFKLKDDFQKHVAFVHSDDKVTCDFCQLTFKHKNTLSVHISSQHVMSLQSEIVKSFKCDFCDKAFRMKFQLDCHVTRLHLEKVELLKCEFCEKSFKLRDNLQKHARCVHSKVHSNN